MKTKENMRTRKSLPERQTHRSPPMRPAGKNRPHDQAGGAEHSGGDAKEDRNP
jgi:hypothetical protein